MRYYKATDGQVTVFRATNRTYSAASFVRTHDLGEVSDIGFSKNSGSYPAVEIGRAEYRQLQQLKVARCKAEGGRGDAAVNSWVRNADIPLELSALIRILENGDRGAPATPRGWDKVET